MTRTSEHGRGGSRSDGAELPGVLETETPMASEHGRGSRRRAVAPARAAALAALLAGVTACGSGNEAGARGTGTARPASDPALAQGMEPPAPATSARVTTAAAAVAPSPLPDPVNVAAYPWLSDRTCSRQVVDGSLAQRFAPPPGLARVPVAEGSFGRWLRGLPLRPSGPVVDHRGRVVVEEGDARVAAVAALDEGAADLQQCADSIVRLHAEWLWSSGKRAVSYRSAAGFAMPFERFAAGDRVIDGKVGWQPLARPSSQDDHGVFRSYLDTVFAWANTGALRRDAVKVDLAELRPGDFFVLAGAPGHAVLVLDVATGARGECALLLGQGYMPAQSFHVLRPSPETAWFRVDPAAGGVQTPFWPAPFPWSSLRRLD